MQQPTEIDKTKLQAVLGGDWRSIQFKSAAPVEVPTKASTGTHGLNAFDIPSHALQLQQQVVAPEAMEAQKREKFLVYESRAQ